nr:ankyrin repeat domain-containing protein [uncultured Treponema sp.]
MKTFKRITAVLTALLLSASAFSYTKKNLLKAVKATSEVQVKKILTMSPELAGLKFDSDGNSILMLAIMYGCNDKIIDHILKAGCSPDLKNKYDQTAIMIACNHGTKAKIIKRMINYNVFTKAGKIRRITMKDKNGKTCFDYAKDKPSIYRLLSEYTIDPASVKQEPDSKLPVPEKEPVVEETPEAEAAEEIPEETEAAEETLEEALETEEAPAEETEPEVQPEPEPQPEPQPAPEPESQPEPEPQPATEPEPAPEPEPAKTAAEIEPVLEAEPVPVPEPVVEAAPVPVAPVPVPIPEPQPEPDPEPEPQPESQPEPAPEPEPEPEPEVIEPVPETQEEAEITSPIEVPAIDYYNSNRPEYLFDEIEADTTVEEETLKALKETKVRVIQNPDALDNIGRTRLMNAIMNNDERTCYILLESGANPNSRDKDGWTPLMYACRYSKSANIVTLLFEYGASINTKSNYNVSVLQIAAAHCQNKNVLSIILSEAVKEKLNIHDAFISALKEERPEDIIREFLKFNVKINALYKGKTPLMYAAQYYESTDVIKLLLDKGADPYIISSEKKNAFSYAKENAKIVHDAVYWSLNVSSTKKR